MSQEHVKDPAYWPENKNTNQVTQNMPKKYTFLAEIKVLQDRLQDMYTNRSDMVNITGDGWAAAHQNEIKEIFWVYLKSLGWISGFHGAVGGVIIGMLGGILAGVLFEAGEYSISLMMFLLTGMFIVWPFGYMTYAEQITEDSGKFVVGQNTAQFHTRMRESMQMIADTTWMMTFVSSGIVFFLVGYFSKTAIHISMGMLSLLGISVADHLQAALYNIGSVYGLGWYVILLAGSYAGRVLYIDRIKREAKAKANENKRTQGQYKYKDNVQEVRNLYNS